MVELDHDLNRRKGPAKLFFSASAVFHARRRAPGKRGAGGARRRFQRHANRTERWVDDALFRPEVRLAFRRLVDQGWTDAIRALHPGERIYTFWDYFRNAWGRNAGLRLDHLLLSKRRRASTLVLDGGRLTHCAARISIKGAEPAVPAVLSGRPAVIGTSARSGRRMRFKRGSPVQRHAAPGEAASR